MSTTVEAIYEGGVLRLPQPLPLPAHSRVMVTVRTPGEDAERIQWLKESEDSLRRVWDNDADGVYKDLLTK